MAAETHPAPTPRTTLPGPMMEAIEVLHPRKTYGATVAVDDVSSSVAEGEIFGILGPNGAGKTTAVECVIGLRSPTRASSGSPGPSPGPRGPARDRGGMGNLFAEGDGF